MARSRFVERNEAQRQRCHKYEGTAPHPESVCGIDTRADPSSTQESEELRGCSDFLEPFPVDVDSINPRNIT